MQQPSDDGLAPAITTASDRELRRIGTLLVLCLALVVAVYIAGVEVGRESARRVRTAVGTPARAAPTADRSGANVGVC
jgi:hypothetical protein